MSLQVIGAGLPRTGTLSLKTALEVLGITPCHHMMNTYQTPSSWSLWQQAAKGQRFDWDTIFAGYAACTDSPGCWFVPELVVHYPAAKFVLTIRDPENWLASAVRTVFSPEYVAAVDRSPFAETGRMLGLKFLSTPGLVLSESPMRGFRSALAAFHAHNAHVVRSVASDRLLIFDVNDGWPPLCEFLNLPIPDVPFPRTNRSADFFSLMLPVLSGRHQRSS